MALNGRASDTFEAVAMAGAERNGTITVVVADDHPDFRQALRELIDELPGFAVIGEAPEGASAVRLAQELRPDLVVMDLQMPLMDGVTATAEITKLDAPPFVVVLTASSASDDVLEALSAGAAGYLLKGATGEEIHAGLRAANDGGAPLSPDIAAALLRHVRQRMTTSPKTLPKASLPQLTKREAKVLELIARGADTKQIAEELFLSSATVKSCIASLLVKLGVNSRAQAAVLAVRAGIA